MTAASTAAAPPQDKPARIAAAVASRPLTVALGLTTVLTVLRLTGTVDSDVAWLLWIAGRIHAGAHLYRDIIETNPPLWFWMALPVDRAAALLHLRAETVLIVGIGSLVGLSLAATSRLLPQITALRRSLLLAYCALTLAAMPWVHVGQREQIALIGTLPYAGLIALRYRGTPVSPCFAGLIGGAAALGFALKHYFLVVPGLLELSLLLVRGRQWRAIRPETIAIAAIGATYAAAVVIFERDFLTTIVPLIRLAYGAFGAPSLRYMFGPFAVLGLATFVLVGAQWRFLRDAPFAAALVVAALGFGVAYFAQFKGWPYHAIPLLGCASLALAALLAESAAPLLGLRLAAPALLFLPLFLAATEWLHPVLPNADLLGATADLQRGDPVLFIGTETAIPWSVTLQGGYRYASRYNGFWMLPAIVRNERLGNPDPRLTALSHQLVAETAVDMRCIPPKRIIVARPRPGEDGFDILPFFERDIRFAELLAHYRARSRTSLETYELASPLPASASACRAGI